MIERVWPIKRARAWLLMKAAEMVERGNGDDADRFARMALRADDARLVLEAAFRSFVPAYDIDPDRAVAEVYGDAAAASGCPIVPGRCPLHGAEHGREAEELRRGVEMLIGLGADDWPDALQRLLDRVNARDSLAFLEGGGEADPRAVDPEAPAATPIRPAHEVARELAANIEFIGNAEAVEEAHRLIARAIEHGRAEGRAEADANRQRDAAALMQAIRAFTVEAPGGQPNGPVEHELGALSKMWYLPAEALDSLARLCATFADQERALRLAAEAFFGGDFRAPGDASAADDAAPAVPTRDGLLAAVEQAHLALHRWEKQAGPGHPLHGEVTNAHDALHRALLAVREQR